MDQSNRPVANDDDAQAIETPFAGHRGLLGTVIGMGLLIVVGIGVVAYGLVYKMSGGKESARVGSEEAGDVEPFRSRLDLASGTGDVESFALGELLAVAGRNAADETVIVIVDPRTGREIGRIFPMASSPDADGA